MIIQGRNLIISANGQVIAGAKSCDISVDADTIPVSSPTDGQWEHSIVGRKSWKVNTSHLMKMDSKPSFYFEAVGTCHNGAGLSKTNYVNNNGAMYYGTSRGLFVKTFDWDDERNRFLAKETATFDTYASTEALADLVDELTNYVDAGDVVSITSYDAYAMNAAVAQAISTKLGIPIGCIPVVEASRASFCCLGVAGGSGIAFCNTNEGSQVHVKLLLNSSRGVMTNTPLKDMLTKPGTVFTIQVQVDGLANDRLSGSAICTNARVTGAVGNISQGSFSFKGTGTLT